jgi:hypothetical protein
MIFVITTHRKREGARLSKPGHWGNIPYHDVDSAERAARDHGAREIKYERY